MKKLFCLKTIISIILIFSIILSFQANIYTVNSVNLLSETKLISNQNDEFLLLTYNDSLFEIYEISEDGISKTANEKFSVKSYLFANNSLYILCSDSKNLPIIKSADNGAVLDAGVISDMSLKENCITATKSDFIYLADNRNPKIVCKYLINGIKVETYIFNENVNSLFTYKSDNIETVYAVTDDGIISVENNYFINCTIPKAPYSFFGNYCCDSNGDVFIFDSDNGFKLFMQTEYENLCIFNNTVYGTKNNSVYMLDNNGTPQAECKLNNSIQQLCVSGSKMAVYCANNVEFLYKEDFISLTDESTEQIFDNEANIPILSEVISEPNDLQSYSTNFDNEVPDYSVSVGDYSFFNDMIIGIQQGTTIAKFKKNISYNSNTIRFTNHNGQVKTSGQLGTGWRVDFIGNGETVSYYIIILGDVTGEGNINSRDIAALSDYLLKKSELSKYAICAADINLDGTANSLDLLLIDKIAE